MIREFVFSVLRIRKQSCSVLEQPKCLTHHLNSSTFSSTALTQKMKLKKKTKIFKGVDTSSRPHISPPNDRPSQVNCLCSKLLRSFKSKCKRKASRIALALRRRLENFHLLMSIIRRSTSPPRTSPKLKCCSIRRPSSQLVGLRPRLLSAAASASQFGHMSNAEGIGN